MVILLHPQFMICGYVLILIFSILFAFFLLRYLKNKRNINLIVAVISASVVITAVGFEVYLYYDFQYQLHYNILEYSLELNSISEKNEVVYFPISENKDLQNSLRVKSGTGDISIIDTEKGTALKVVFSGKIEIYGKIDTTKGIGKHDLTMLNQTVKYRNVEYWIYYKSYDSSNYNCSFKLKLYHEALDWRETHYGEGYLLDGWNTYRAKWSAVS